MKKEQKIIELRTAAKLKVAELETKIAFTRSEAAKKRSSVMRERANELKGLEAGGTERYDVLAKYRAELADVEWTLADDVAQLKSEIQQVKAECEKKCAAAKDDPESEKEQPQPTVYCDGSEHSARIVARRLINKMPHIPIGGFLFVHIIRDNDGSCYVTVSESDSNSEKYDIESFYQGYHNEENEREFVEQAREMFKTEEDEASAKAAGPISRALDAVFGGNPVEQVDNLISDTIKDGKEGGNE